MMECELCGRKVKKLLKIRIEGAILNVCEECAIYGEVVRERSRVERKRPQVTIEYEEEEWELVEDAGEKIRREREKREWKVEELAQRAGVPVSVIRKLEKGEKIEDLKVIKKIERVLGLKLTRKAKKNTEWKYDAGKGFEITLADVAKVRR